MAWANLFLSFPFPSPFHPFSRPSLSCSSRSPLPFSLFIAVSHLASSSLLRSLVIVSFPPIPSGSLVLFHAEAFAPQLRRIDGALWSTDKNIPAIYIWLYYFENDLVRLTSASVYDPSNGKMPVNKHFFEQNLREGNKRAKEWEEERERERRRKVIVEKVAVDRRGCRRCGSSNTSSEGSNILWCRRLDVYQRHEDSNAGMVRIQSVKYIVNRAERNEKWQEGRLEGRMWSLRKGKEEGKTRKDIRSNEFTK